MPGAKKTTYRKRAARSSVKSRVSSTTSMQARSDHSEVIQCFRHVTGTPGANGALGITIPINPSKIPSVGGDLALATTNPQWNQIQMRYEQFRVKGASLQITFKHCDASVFTAMDTESRNMTQAEDFLGDAGMKITHLSADKRTVYLSYKPVARSTFANFQNTDVPDLSVLNEAFGHVLQLCPGAVVAPSCEVLIKYYIACRGMKRFNATSAIPA
jgi:hypothetical protein